MCLSILFTYINIEKKIVKKICLHAKWTHSFLKWVIERADDLIP